MDFTNIIEGSKIGRWVIVDSAPIKKNGRKYILCKCSCESGTVKYVNLSNLKRGSSYSCGCLNREVLKKVNTKHSKAYTSTWNVWRSMINRAHEYTSSNSFYYKDKNIKVCDRWLGENGFVNFLEDMGEKPDATTLDRINNDGDYEPSNCRWTSGSQQALNRGKRRDNTSGRTGILLEESGKYRVVFVVNKKTIYGKRHKTFHDALNEIRKLELQHLGKIRE